MRVAGITEGFLEEVVFPTHADLRHKLYDPKESVELQGTISSVEYTKRTSLVSWVTTENTRACTFCRALDNYPFSLVFIYFSFYLLIYLKLFA